MATLRQLEYFVAVVDQGSFTQAAALMNVTQPGLSHQFAALEREVGGRLVERLPRSVRLTPAGRAMLPSARAALADAGRGVAAARRVTGVASGDLQVATLYSISYGILPDTLARWRTRHPRVRVTLFEHRRSEDMATAMAAGQADVAIGPEPPEWDGVTRVIGVEEFLVVTAKNDPVTRFGTNVRLSDLAERDWVHFTRASGLGDALDRACTAAGFQPRAALRTEQGPNAVNFAAAGLGPTLVPANVIPRHFPGLILRPDPPLERTLTAYTRVGTDPITAAFLDVLTDVSMTPHHVHARLAGRK